MAGEIVSKDLPVIQKLVQDVLGVDNYKKIERLGGLTNRTYKVTLEDEQVFILRAPGEGTEELIVRKDEKVSTELACELGIDAELLYFGEDGLKVTKYIPEAVTMSAETLKEPKHIVKMAGIFKKLHESSVDTGVTFDVFEMAAGYEKIIFENHVSMYPDYTIIKNWVMEIKNKVDKLCDIKRVPCHNDPLCENWVMSEEDRMYLIDWEYAGMNDGIWDIADVSIEAGFDELLDEMILTEYLGNKPTTKDWKHFLANKLYVDYLWTLWAKTRVPYDGQAMEDWATERYERLKGNITAFHRLEGEE